MVTRTCCLAGALFSMQNSPQKSEAAPLGAAQLIDLAQQLFDAAAYLFALGMQGLDFIRQERGLAFGFGRILHSGLPFLTQTRHQLHGALYALFQITQGIDFLFRRAHSFSRANRADSFTAMAD